MSEQDDILNKQLPNFKLETTTNKHLNIEDCKGKPLVLFFYPKDNTPVCTSEAKAFRDSFVEFEKLDTTIFGVSRDTLASHERFKAKLELPFELISDSGQDLCNYFDVIRPKNFFGKIINGISRSTFLLDRDLVVKKAWRGVKVNGHIDEVLAAIKSL